MEVKINYYLEIADNALILSHRLSENCSRGPFLEEDLACTNVALDLIGWAESMYNEAGKISDNDRTGDDFAYRRSENEYTNCLLVEQPNNDFAYLMVRQFLIDTFNYNLCLELTNSKDAFLSAVATKSIKEITYHLKRSSEWMLRFGNGTEVSKEKAQTAINDLWRYTDELFKASESNLELRSAGISADLEKVKENWEQKVNEIFYLANLKKPENQFQLFGGKTGRHSEHMGFLLNDMQFLTNKYPDAKW
jgi:ring-1,2-phenylacetyl-CoA epoxidase subunit PaaC